MSKGRFITCGCAEQEELDLMLLDILEYFSTTEWKFEEYITNSKHHSKGTFYLIGHYLDEKDFVSHGSSLRCAWLTDSGKDLLKDLQKQFKDETVS